MHTPNLKKIRRILFWDTKLENIDWVQHYKYVIRRAFEKGNEEEKQEIIRFYGNDKVEEVLKHQA